MLYDFDRVKERVMAARKKFIIKFATLLVLMLSSFVVILLTTDNNVKFSFAVFEAFFVFFIFRLMKKSSPLILFKKSVRGINLKEHEFVFQGRVGLKLGNKNYLLPRGENRVVKTSHPIIAAKVYLKLENGDIFEIGGLRRAHTDIYEENDVLYKAEGVRYPIILNRNTKKQPCPWCGEINREGFSECSSCGLSIIEGIELPVYYN